MRISKKITAIVMTVIMAVAALSVVVSAANISLKKTAVSINYGGTYQQKLLNGKKAISATSVVWKSANTKIAKIDKNGKITAVNSGKANCTATYKKTVYKFTVTVKSPKLNATSKSIYYGEATTLKVSNTSTAVKWSTSNANVASVTSKGVVKAVGLGNATITAKVGSKKLTCKVKVIDRNASAKVSFNTSDGGYFIAGQCTAKAAFSIPSCACGRAVASIVSADGTTVYKKTFTKLKKNTNYGFAWDGKNSAGNYVDASSYRLKITVGTKDTYSSYLAFKTTNDFAGGNGSKSNPFQIASVSQFAKIARYANANFKQINNLDFNYTAVGNFFSKDNPFNGTYDGNKKTVSKISSTYPIFNALSARGEIKNMIFSKCSVVANECAVIVKDNYGKISNCTVNCTLSGVDQNSRVGAIAAYNSGTIINCSVSGSISATGAHTNTGGLVGINWESGKIISCSASASVTTDSWEGITGGAVGFNKGLITDCEASGSVSRHYGSCGGIVGENNGQIISSTYSGSSQINAVGYNNGVIA